MSISFLSSNWKRPRYVVLEEHAALENEELHESLTVQDHADQTRQIFLSQLLFCEHGSASRPLDVEVPHQNLVDGSTVELSTIFGIDPAAFDEVEWVSPFLSFCLGTALAAVGAGNARLGWRQHPFVDGTDLTDGAVSWEDIDVAIPASANNQILVVVREPAWTTTPATLADSLGAFINIRRVGGHANDTYAGDLHFYGVWLHLTGRY